MTDPLAQIVTLLQPDLSYSKFVEGAGAWRVRRAEQGRPFFCALLEGSIRLELHGRAPLIVEQGDFVLIPAAHDFATSSTAAAPPAGVDNLPVEVRADVFRLGDPLAEPEVRMLVGYCAFGSGDAALLVTLLPALLHARGERRLATLAQLAAEELRSDRPGRDVILTRLMEVLFIETLRSSGPHCPCGVLKGLGDDRVATAIRRMHEQPTTAWTVARLASEAAMSRSAFFDRFRRAVGTAPMEYLLHWRMVLAKEMLRSDAGSVGEIARQVGYGSASAFSVAFTRHVGMPPSVYARASHERQPMQHGRVSG
ncbi:AraC family transcriptional regulator [Hephaestia sp. GCM10023244]|uniref:AraC family transcriptional regulator n=1 Tax=unclassified Hephaestia TaxID=2631281 RepID=UPI0020778888|nr:AraC family transcriptional regulator [Hephaestia sp. MAHUQ-44]MCM8730393.1 AraC family transcriptional regulator [Hephaestia sp. MAHUQ-44]